MAVPNAADKSATGCEPIDSVMGEETFVFGSENGGNDMRWNLRARQFAAESFFDSCFTQGNTVAIH